MVRGPGLRARLPDAGVGLDRDAPLGERSRDLALEAIEDVVDRFGSAGAHAACQLFRAARAAAVALEGEAAVAPRASLAHDRGDQWVSGAAHQVLTEDAHHLVAEASVGP